MVISNAYFDSFNFQSDSLDSMRHFVGAFLSTTIAFVASIVILIVALNNRGINTPTLPPELPFGHVSNSVVVDDAGQNLAFSL